MNKNENTVVQSQRARIVAMGRKPIAELEPGDRFSHSWLGDLEFLGWMSDLTAGSLRRGAWVRETFAGSPTRAVPLNSAGSVQMMD